MKLAIESSASQTRDPWGERPVRGRCGMVLIALGIAANVIWMDFSFGSCCGCYEFLSRTSIMRLTDNDRNVAAFPKGIRDELGRVLQTRAWSLMSIQTPWHLCPTVIMVIWYGAVGRTG